MPGYCHSNTTLAPELVLAPQSSRRQSRFPNGPTCASLPGRCREWGSKIGRKKNSPPQKRTEPGLTTQENHRPSLQRQRQTKNVFSTLTVHFPERRDLGGKAMVPFLGGGLLPQGGLKVVSFLSKRKGRREDGSTRLWEGGTR